MSEKLEDMNKEELMEEAKRLDIDGRSGMDKAELLAAVQAAGDSDESQGETQDISAGTTVKAEQPEQTTENGGFAPQGAGETDSADEIGDLPRPSDAEKADDSDVDPVLDSEADYSEPTIEYVSDVNPVKSRVEEENEQHERRKAGDAEVEARQAAGETNPW